MTDKMDLETRLNAFLDGELAPDERELTERLIEADPVIAARVDALTRTRALSEGASRERAERPGAQPIDALIERLERELGAPAPPPMPETREAPQVPVRPAAQRNANIKQSAQTGPLALLKKHRAIAAGFAVAIGIWAMLMLMPAQTADKSVAGASGRLAPDQGVGAVFETVPSGDTADLGENIEAAPQFSFATADTYCRVVDIAGPQTDSRLVGCKAGDGWQIEIATYTSASAAAVDTYVEEMMAGDTPLSGDAEAELIRTGWAASPGALPR
ncbi:anti-sigma factor family protein [Henriciella litoralis]|uniref:anti-sigma factor family protein n=1 Tax=Henriciella litoralis TaxID=568102 RepID=UPI000A05F726|nr:hypothetical protein [Henriciella litoralis]